MSRHKEPKCNKFFIFIILTIFNLFIREIYSESYQSSMKIVVNDCKLTEPVYNYTFDFTDLKSDLGHLKETEKGDSFAFNVCGKLTKPCANFTNVAACYTHKNIQHVLGTNHSLTYDNGRMYFSFDGGHKCNDFKNYTLNLLIACDYAMQKRMLNVMTYAENECSFYITWKTRNACLPEPENVKSNACAFDDKKSGHNFNLMSLSSENYAATDRNGSFFVINVCKPVLYGQNAMCPPGSSICYLDKTSKDIKNKFTNFGTVEPNPTMDGYGQLFMKFKSEIKCPGSSEKNVSSIIYFICDPRVKFGVPDFMQNKDCLYEFTWETSLACKTEKPCRGVDPSTGVEYDFNGLSSRQYDVSHNKEKYTFSVCSNRGPPCLEHAGSCKTSQSAQSTSLGVTSSEIRFNGTASPHLLYGNGAVCRNSSNGESEKWTTKIEFICSSSVLDLWPTVVENTNCQLVIHFATEMACHEQITCQARSFVNGDESIDLTALISTTVNYVAKVNRSGNEIKGFPNSDNESTKYFINVCRPLIPEYGLSCPGGSAACRATVGTATPEKEMSLGFPDVELTLIEKSRAQLKYLRGSPCPSDNTTQLSSSVEFYCDVKAGKGIPILQSIVDQCHYQFDWGTNVICPSHKCDFNLEKCTIINPETNKELNLKSSRFTDAEGKIKVKEFVIDLCATNSPSSAAVGIGQEQDRKAVTDYSQSAVKIFLKVNGQCDGKGFSFELRLVCSETEHRASSSDENNCNVVLTQETPEVCAFIGIELSSTASTTTTKIPATEIENTSISPGGSQNEDKVDRNSSHVAIVVAVIFIVLASIATATYFYFREPVRRIRIRNYFRQNTVPVQYSRVQTNEEANLLLPSAGHLTDSDDDILRL